MKHSLIFFQHRFLVTLCLTGLGMALIGQGIALAAPLTPHVGTGTALQGFAPSPNRKPVPLPSNNPSASDSAAVQRTHPGGTPVPPPHRHRPTTPALHGGKRP